MFPFINIPKNSKLFSILREPQRTNPRNSNHDETV